MAFKRGQSSWNKGKRRGQIVQCLTCNKDMYRQPSALNKWAYFCSKAHQKQNPLLKDKLVLNLNQTGKKHSLESIEKMSKAHLGRTGERAGNWRGGLRTRDYLERRRFRHQMQKNVFKRDDYTCQLCGVRGVDLQVDHIQSWADYVELRFSLDNCRTLCMACHYLITFGKPKPKNITWGHNFGRRKQP